MTSHGKQGNAILGMLGERRPPALEAEELRVGAPLEQRPIRVVQGGVRGVKNRLRCEQVERAPTQAPRIDLERGEVRDHGWGE